jgi:glycosyltransferase involved in cell wall biosynthesis
MLIISFVEWSGAFQRPQHMAIGFARRGWDVTYVSPGYVHRRGQRVESGLDLPENLRVLEPAALPGARKIGLVGDLNEAWIERAIRQAREGEWDVIVFNDPRWSRIAAAIPAGARIWDCMDDLSAHAPSAAWIEEREREALAAATRIWTGTAMLADRLANAGSQARFIACGVEGERFASPGAEAIASAKGEIESIFPSAAPLAGYFGVINERFDMRLLAALAENNWNVLLIGPVSSQTPPTPDSPHVRMIGPRPYASLPAYLACMDLALIPYVTSGPNRFLYPVKALEYLAGGRPVLSTSLPDLARFLSEYLLLRDTPEQWAAVAGEWDTTKAEAASRAQKGQSYALSRGWDAMISEMSEDLSRL